MHDVLLGFCELEGSVEKLPVVLFQEKAKL